MIKSLIPQYKLDFSQPIIGYGNFTYQQSNSIKCHIDMELVNQKLKLWDEVISNHPDDNSHLKLLKDKTILSYAQFKLNAKPFRARWFQDVILSDNYDRILFIGSNQIGKSVTLDDDAATDFLMDHGKEFRILIVSNSLTQSKERMGNIRQMLDTADIEYKEEDNIKGNTKTGKQVSMTAISYTFRDDKGKPKYTTKLICCPHTSAALGYPVDLMLLDEIEFWDNVKGGTLHWVKQVAIPRTFDTHGKIKAYSNPIEGGVMNQLMKERGKDGKLLWHVYRFNYWDRVDSNQDYFDRQIIGMNREEVASTMLGDFARAEGAFFSKEEISEQFSPELQQLGDNAGYNKETYWFLDVGETHDQCCLIGLYAQPNPNPLAQEQGLPLINAFWIHKYPVGYPIARVIGAESEFTKDDGWEDNSEDNPSVKDVLNEYAEVVNDKAYLPMFGFDATGNAALLPLFQSIDIDAMPIKFQGANKWHMYQRYQMYTQQRWFKRCKDRDNNAIMSPDGCLSNFPYQASKLRIKKKIGTGTSYRQIHHENENDLDDTQDAVSAGIFMIEGGSTQSGQLDIINNGKSVLKEVLEEKEENDKLEGQYVPSFYNKDELKSWIDKRQDYT